MSLYEGAVKKPIMTSLCFLAVAIFGVAACKCQRKQQNQA